MSRVGGFCFSPFPGSTQSLYLLFAGLAHISACLLLSKFLQPLFQDALPLQCCSSPEKCRGRTDEKYRAEGDSKGKDRARLLRPGSAHPRPKEQ